jgi:hypothetical protein
MHTKALEARTMIPDNASMRHQSAEINTSDILVLLELTA